MSKKPETKEMDEPINYLKNLGPCIGGQRHTFVNNASLNPHMGAQSGMICRHCLVFVSSHEIGKLQTHPVLD